MWPWFLPDGRHFLYAAGPPFTINVGSLDSGDRASLTVASDSKVMYARGYLLFVRQGALLAQPFDTQRLTASGEASPIVQGITASRLGGFSPYSTSSSGVLAYRAGGSLLHQLTWLDRSGRHQGVVGEAGDYRNFDLSLDAQHVVVSGNDVTEGTVVTSGGSRAWVFDVSRGVGTRVSPPNRSPGDVVWAPDGRRFAYNIRPSGEIFEQPAFGGPERLLYKGAGQTLGLEDWSHDGRYLAIEVAVDNRRQGLVVPVDGSPPLVVAESSGLLDEFHFSPDGRWIVYNSDETGRHEVYLAPVPSTGERFKVSTGGGVQGRWRGDGKELFYLALDGTMMAVNIQLAASPQIGTPVPLFKVGFQPTYNLDHYGVTSDGQRFLVSMPLTDSDSAPITVVLDWTTLLKK
jgi:dipeptidyl aminopeptidase/acylaminoacyl peptidase